MTTHLLRTHKTADHDYDPKELSDNARFDYEITEILQTVHRTVLQIFL